MVKISFQIITFNSLSILPQGMFKACLDNIYSFAHEILIAEGAVEPTFDNKGDATSLSSDGRSTDGTLEFLYSYYDPDKKVKIFKKDDYWCGKTEMCNIISQNATGDYLWQVDSDEFFHKEDIEKIIDILSIQEFDRVDFYANQFCKDFYHCCDEEDVYWSNLIPWMRIFRHEPKSQWYSHAPPIYLDSQGQVRNKNVLTRDMTLMMGIKLYHYSMVSRTQAEFKQKYYKAGGVDWLKLYDLWQEKEENNRVIGESKFKKFDGRHPSIIEELIKNEIK